jgi:hypothetical protein
MDRNTTDCQVWEWSLGNRSAFYVGRVICVQEVGYEDLEPLHKIYSDIQASIPGTTNVDLGSIVILGRKTYGYAIFPIDIFTYFELIVWLESIA